MRERSWDRFNKSQHNSLLCWACMTPFKFHYILSKKPYIYWKNLSFVMLSVGGTVRPELNHLLNSKQLPTPSDWDKWDKWVSRKLHHSELFDTNLSLIRKNYKWMIFWSDFLLYLWLTEDNTLCFVYSLITSEQPYIKTACTSSYQHFSDCLTAILKFITTVEEEEEEEKKNRI